MTSLEGIAYNDVKQPLNACGPIKEGSVWSSLCCISCPPGKVAYWLCAHLVVRMRGNGGHRVAQCILNCDAPWSAKPTPKDVGNGGNLSATQA